MARSFGECERLSRLESEEGLIPEAIATARLWARHAPLEEAAYRRLMELLSGVGESERALLLAYEGFKNTLNRELGMEPSAPLQELAARLREEAEQRALWVRALYTRQLLVRFLSLRYRWLAARRSLGRCLRVHAAREGQMRVVAVLGEAGIGKSRLSEEFLLGLKPGELTSSNVKPRREQACLMGRS